MKTNGKDPKLVNLILGLKYVISKLKCLYFISNVLFSVEERDSCIVEILSFNRGFNLIEEKVKNILTTTLK